MDEIVLNVEETRQAVKSTVALTGFTEAELIEMGTAGVFRTEAARRAWFAVKDLLPRVVVGVNEYV